MSRRYASQEDRGLVWGQDLTTGTCTKDSKGEDVERYVEQRTT